MIRSYIAGYPILLPEHRSRFHLEHPEWHKAWLDSIHESLKPDDVVIDVGAEQGDLSALVASWVPDGGIVLVEPQPAFWPTIRETFEANGLKPRLNLVGFASDKTQRKEPIGNGLWADWPDTSWEPARPDPGFYHFNEHDVATWALDDITPHRGKINALIIDSEGSELYVLHGAEQLLRGTHPLVWCAVHPESMMLRYGHDANELLAFMYRMGYRWDLLGFASEIHVKFSPR